MQQIQRTVDPTSLLAPTPAPAPHIEIQRALPVTPIPQAATPAAAAPVVAHWGTDAAVPASPLPAAATEPAIHNGPATAAPTPGPAAEPPRLDRTQVHGPLRQGSKGDQVQALQHFLGMDDKAADGAYGPGTAGQVKAWQGAHGLAQTGSIDARTIAAMRGDQYIYGYNFNQDPGKFIPKYAMTAYHESNDMRNAVDPYATGAITHPTKEQDPGGKTYGTYQFESYTYPGGTNAGDKKVADSTLSRFVNWKDNPYSKEFKDVIAKNGVGSAEFDALWKKESTDHNKAFGAAQEQFLEFDKAAQVKAMFDKMGASEDARKDPRVVDLLMGTSNQLGGLANTVASDVNAQQAKHGKAFTSDELARAIVEDKISNVDTFFSHSEKKTRDGVRERFLEERSEFAPPPVVKAATPPK